LPDCAVALIGSQNFAIPRALLPLNKEEGNQPVHTPDHIPSFAPLNIIFNLYLYFQVITILTLEV
jgi:hypothetical protein